jgi:pimeloyl-ACP methyl ester carboxylesterase
MVLTGDKDKMIPKEHSDRIVEHMDGAEDLEYLVVADAGHLVLLEKPQEVTDALTRLVRRVVAEQNARRSAS